MSVPDWLPFAVARPVTYYGDAGPFTAAPLGWIPHVVVGLGSPWSGFQNAVPGKRKFSHLWVAKDGTVEQYAPLSSRSWAQADGNGTYWSCETEGFPDEPYTAAQIVSLARIHNALGAADLIATKPGDRGVGTHFMGGAAWGGHSCPDPVGLEGKGPRSRARVDIIAAAQAQRTGGPDMPITEDDAYLLWTKHQIQTSHGLEAGARILAIARDQATSANSGIAAVSAKVDALQQAVAGILPGVTGALQGLPAAVVAALPPASTGGYTPEQITAAVEAGIATAFAGLRITTG